MTPTALSRKFDGFTSRFSADPERSATLPAYFYYDADTFAREKEAIWFKTWQFVGWTHDLDRAGAYITANILDQRVFVIRAKNGELRAFYNVCMHRGHILLEGKGNKGIITCPFHAWSYDTFGVLKAAGNAENVASFQLEDFNLVEVQVETLAFMVYVNLDPAAPSLKSQAGELEHRFRRAIPGFDRLKFAQRKTFPIKANWKFILDGLECYHCPVIHPQAMSAEESPLLQAWESEEVGIWQEHIIKGNRDVIAGRKGALPYELGDALIVDSYIWYLWPNMVFTCEQGPSNFMILHAMATGAETCERHVINFCLNDPPSRYEQQQFDNYTDLVFQQDRRAMERQADGVKALGYREGRLMVDRERSWRSEHGTHHFEHLVWTALGEEGRLKC
ncbi:MAG: aromatic ring-hydroxylating dioxygenase subunit alpha [Alphaproteobacteria bacterium]|nr:aromatic ring-hydroxylating dioxygenase subunit alpha [Alphaproteobacteria bacterium]